MSEIIIDTANPNELPEAACLACRAMIDLPENKAVFSGKRHRMESSFQILFKKNPGKVLLARDGDHIIGVMRMIEWPECKPSPLEGLKMLPSMVYALKGSLFRSMKLQALWAKYDPREHHWHFGPFAVKPEMQKQGIGNFMMNHFCKFIDSQNSAGYLETGTMENVRFYEKFGFSVISKASFYDAVTRFMWRPKSTTA